MGQASPQRVRASSQPPRRGTTIKERIARAEAKKEDLQKLLAASNAALSPARKAAATPAR